MFIAPPILENTIPRQPLARDPSRSGRDNNDNLCPFARPVYASDRIRYAVSPIWPRLTFPGFGLAYVATVIALISAAYGLRRLKQRYRPRAFLMTLLLGG